MNSPHRFAVFALSLALYSFCIIDRTEAINIGNYDNSLRTWNHISFTDVAAMMTGAGHTIEPDGLITAAGLANDDLFVIGEGLQSPTAAEIADLANWVRGGGCLLVFTNSNFSGGDAGNDILTGIGSSMSFSSDSINAMGPFQGGNFATTGPPFNLVGQNMGVTPGNIVSGGTLLYGTAVPADSGVHVEQLGAGFVYAFGDRYDHDFFSPSAANNNGRLFLNIAQHHVPEPSTLSLVALGLCGLFFHSRRRRK